MNIFYFVLCRYGHMIDNVVLIVTATLHERDVQELLEKCHPLGMFYWVFAPKPLIRVIGFRNIFLLKSPVLILEHSPLIIFLSFSFIALVFNIFNIFVQALKGIVSSKLKFYAYNQIIKCWNKKGENKLLCLIRNKIPLEQL